MASNMNIMGTYSGITMDTIDQLIQAESGKVTRYTNEQKAMEAEKTAWKDVETRLSNLTDKLSALEKSEAFASKTVTTNMEGKVAVTAAEEAMAGTYEVTVERLATRTQLIGMKLEEKKLDEAFGAAGTLTIATQYKDNPEQTFSVEIKAEDTLKDILAAINEQGKEAGVSAVLIDNHVVLQSNEYGARSLTLSGTVTEALGLTGTPAIGKDAQFTLNNITIERPTNTITDAIQGITIELQAVSEAPIQVKVADDQEKTVATIKELVDQYNSTLSFIGKQLDVGDPSLKDNKTGALSGDSSLMRLESQLRNLLTQPVDFGNGKVGTAKDIGITVDRYGTATLDEAKLKEALKKDAQTVKDLFSFTKSETVTENGVPVEKTEKIGISDRMKTVLDTYTNSTNGIIKTRNETYDRLIKDLNERIDVFNERLEEKRQHYIATFTALDIAMMEAESQMNYLASQIGSWSANTQ